MGCVLPALRLGADSESEDDQYRKCGGQWALERAVHHNRLDVLLRIARTGTSLWHRLKRPTASTEFRNVAGYSYAIHSRILSDDDEEPSPPPAQTSTALVKSSRALVTASSALAMRQQNHTQKVDATGRPSGLAAGIDARPGLAQEVGSVVDPLGRTPLIYACDVGNVEWVDSLLACGVDVSQVSHYGIWSPCFHIRYVTHFGHVLAGRRGRLGCAARCGI
jgi:hypothetical protein